MSNDPYAAPTANLDNNGAAATIPTSIWNAKGRLGVLSYMAQSLVLVLVFTLAIVVIAAVAGMLGGGLESLAGGSLESIDFSNPVFIVAAVLIIPLYILMLYFTVCMMIKRLHDRNHSGWWSLALIIGSIIPFVNIIAIIAIFYVIFFPGNKIGNRFGGPRITKGWEKVLGIIYIGLLVAGLVAAVVGGGLAFMNLAG